ncbi:MAG: 4-hydroxybenzoate octaprenyltransferase [Sphingomonadaceae bacterium]
MSAVTPDAVVNWVDRLPAGLQPWARLARFDRPAGMWLLFWPCLWGTFMAPAEGWWRWWPLFLVGSFVMRSAGCIFNDIADRDMDRQVARTAARPLASGQISLSGAWASLILLSLIGLGVLLALPRQAQIMALASLLLVAAYPFMKRITWWPQAWLGLTFNWGIPVGWAAALPNLRADWPVMALAYAAGVAWTLGYDTIYAVQDREDDVLAGVKSSARALGRHVKTGVTGFLGLAWLLLTLSLVRWTGEWSAAWLLAPVALHFLWQATTFNPDDNANALRRFRSNFFVGALVALAYAGAALLYEGVQPS